MRTRPVKGITIFAFIVLIVSILLIVFFALSFNKENTVISILTFVFCGAFSLVSIFVLFNQLFCFIELKENTLIRHILWIKKTTKIEKITKIILEEGIYKIFIDNKKFCDMPSAIKGSNEIIIELEKNGISIK